MPGFRDFVKSNLSEGARGTFGGKAGLIFGPLAIADIAQADNKLKAVLRTLKDIVLFKPIMAGLGVSMFSGMRKAVNSLVHDTGSLEAALRKLQRIQGLERIFTPLVGGAEAAKRKVAELVNLAASKNLKLEQVGESARILQIFTRGAQAGSDSLARMADAAADTGNAMEDVSSAFGDFASTLRGGGSIQGVSEGMRRMGLITQDTADKLVQLQNNGATTGQIMETLTSALDEFSGGAERAKVSIDGVNQAFETAQETLKEKFASPWVDDDIENTQKMTAAMQALAPVAEHVGRVYFTLFGGVSQLKATMAQWLAQDAGIQTMLKGLADGLGLVVTAAGALGAISLTSWLLQATGAMASLGASTSAMLIKLIAFLPLSAGAAATAASWATSIGGAVAAFGPMIPLLGAAAVALGAIAVGAGIFYRVAQAAEKERQEVEKLAKAHDEAAKKLREQADAAETMEARHEALTAAIKAENDALEELAETRRKYGNSRRLTEAERNAANMTAERERQEEVGPTGARKSKELEQLQLDQAERSRRLREETIQTGIDRAGPNARLGLLTQDADRLKNQGGQAKVNEQISAGIAQKGKEMDLAITATTAEVDRLNKALTEIDEKARSGHPLTDMDIRNRGILSEQASAANLRLAYQTDARKKLGANAPEGSSAHADYMARNAQTGEDRQQWEIQSKIAKAEEARGSELQERGRQREAEALELGKQIALDQQRARIEQQIAELKEVGLDRARKETEIRLQGIRDEMALAAAKNGGLTPAEQAGFEARKADILRDQRERERQRNVSILGVNSELGLQRAELGNDVKGMAAIKDFDLFAQKMEQLRGHGIVGQEARDISTQYATNAIAIDARRGSMAAIDASVGDSLTDIGGGGGIYAVQDDPNVSIGERTNTLLEQIDEKIGMLTGENKASLKLQ